MAKKNNNMIGSWAFTIGVVVAILLGVLSGMFSPDAKTWLSIALIVIGIIVGLLNITGDETHQFLITAAILVFVSSQGADKLAAVWAPLADVFSNLMSLFVPATIVVAIKAVFALARD
jgi:hypothetical protein